MPGRFFNGFSWRFIVTDLDGVVLTILDRRAMNRRVTAKLGAAWEASMQMPSADPVVNILRPPGGTFTSDPFVQEGIGLLWGFRDEDTLSPPASLAIPWTPRFGGIILEAEDDADTDLATTTIRAWDSWMYLYARPVRDPDTGDLPGENGLTYTATNADEIAQELIDTTISNDGSVHCDTTTGQIDPCEAVTINFQRGTSVGEALDELMATGACEIMFTPIYEPLTNPGIVCELNVAPELGQTRNNAIMAWDKPGRSLTALNRRRDGNRRTNVIQYYAGQGGSPVAEYDDATSVNKFGTYFEQMFLVGKDTDETQLDALRQLSLRSYGEVTYRASPATARSPIALLEYEPGDTVPVYASSRFRETLAEDLRVMEIPIEISDNAEETVRGLTLAPIPTVES